MSRTSLLPRQAAAALTLALLALHPIGPAAAEPLRPSALWGRDGEAWDPKGRLPDFSRAGYHEGAERFPLRAFEQSLLLDVTKPPYSADPTGVRPASAAIQRAIDDLAARPGGRGGVIRLPAGTYLLPDRIRLHASRIVLKGEGPDRTVLAVPQGLRERYPDRNCRLSERAGKEICDRQVIFGGIILIGPKAADAPARPGPAPSPAPSVDPDANPEMTARAPDLDRQACDIVGIHPRGERRLTVDGPYCWRPDRVLKRGDRVVVRVRDADGGEAPTTPFAATKYLWEDFARASYSTKPEPYPASCNNTTMDHKMKPAFRVDGDVLVANVVAVDRAARTVELDRPLRMDADPALWPSRLDHAVPGLEEVAVMGLTIRFPDRTFGSAQLTGADRAEDGIYLDGVDQCLIDNVRFTNVELGIFAHRTRNCTFHDIEIDGYAGRPNGDRELKSSVTTWFGLIGKTGIGLNGQDNLLRDIRLRGVFAHDLSLSQIANGNVISKVTSPNLSIDHHGKAPFENLYTNIDAGDGRDDGTEKFRPMQLIRGRSECPFSETWPEAKLFAMGGSSPVTRNMGVRNTYWNVKTRVPAPLVPMHIEGNIRGPLETNVVGVDVAQPDVLGAKGAPGRGPWLEGGYGRSPLDLYEAQVMRRLGRPPAY